MLQTAVMLQKSHATFTHELLRVHVLLARLPHRGGKIILRNISLAFIWMARHVHLTLS